MKKVLGVLGLAVAVLIVALALTSGYADKAIGRSTCPSGTQKFVQVCIEKEARTEQAGQQFLAASATCAALGRRLPTGAELDGFRQQPGVDITPTPTFGYEWTGDILSSSTSLAMLDEEALVPDGRYYLEPADTSSQPFRCVK
jgi:hypothetical protein